MWFQILPSMTIIGVSLCLPHYFIYYTNKYILGNPYKRGVHTIFDAHNACRDMRISGVNNPYKQKYLECIKEEYIEEEEEEEDLMEELPECTVKGVITPEGLCVCPADSIPPPCYSKNEVSNYPIVEDDISTTGADTNFDSDPSYTPTVGDNLNEDESETTETSRVQASS